MRQLHVTSKKFHSYMGSVREGEWTFTLHLDEPSESKTSGRFVLKKLLPILPFGSLMSICLMPGSVVEMVNDLNSVDKPEEEKNSVKALCELNGFSPCLVDGELMVVNFEKLVDACS